MSWEKACEFARSHKKDWNQQGFILWRKLRASHSNEKRLLQSLNEEEGYSFRKSAISFARGVTFAEFCRRVENCFEDPIFINKDYAECFDKYLDNWENWSKEQYRKLRNARIKPLINKACPYTKTREKLNKNAKKWHIHKGKMFAGVGKEIREHSASELETILNYIEGESCSKILRIIVELVVSAKWQLELADKCGPIIDCFRQMLANLVAACRFDVPIDTTLADKENRFIFPAGGVAASSEQHAFSLLSVRLSMIEKQSAHGLVLAASTNHGGRYYAHIQTR